MAVFNPNVPQINDPNWLKDSKEIAAPSVDTSTGTFLKEAGQDFDAAVTLADSSIKEGIKKDIQTGVDPIRDAYTSSLEAMRNGNVKSTIPDPNDAVGPVDETKGHENLMWGRTNDIPPALQNGVDKATAIAEAQNQGVGHQNDTAYTGALTALTKNLRAQWPGYRDYIDEEVSKVSGIPIANAYIKNMLEDINRQQTQANSEKEKTLTMIRDRMGYPAAQEVYNNYVQSGNIQPVLEWANKNDGVKNLLQLKKLAADSAAGDKSAAAGKVDDYAQTIVSQTAIAGYTNNRFAQGDKSPAEMHQAILDYQTKGAGADNDQAIRMAGQKFQAYAAQAKAQAMAKLMEPGPDGVPYAAKMTGGVAAARKLVDETIGSLYDTTTNLIYSKDYGMANTNQSMAEAAINDTNHKILYNGGPNSIADTSRIIGAFNRISPNFAPFLMNNAMKKGLQDKLEQFSTHQGLNAVMQPNLADNGGQPYTLAQSFDDLTKYGKASNIVINGAARQAQIDPIQAITDPNQKDPTIKLNAFQYFFNPANEGVMGKYKDDYYDPAQKRMIPGRTSVFNQIVSPAVVAEAKKMADQGNRQPLDQMSSWAQKEASTELISNQVKDLNDVLQDRKYKVTWNNDGHKFDIVNLDGSQLAGLHASPLNIDYRTVTNLNSVLGNLKTIAEARGENVDAYLYKTMLDAGLSTKEEIPGVAAGAMKAMRAAAGGRPVELPEVNVSRFAPEDNQGPSVQDFVKNPTAIRAGSRFRNLSEDGDITGVQVDNIPEGMSARDYIKQLQSRNK